MRYSTIFLMAVGYFLGPTYILGLLLSMRISCTWRSGVSAVFCWYGTWINQQLQQTCLLHVPEWHW